MPVVLGQALIAFVVVSMAASGGYLVNDMRDAERDRLHPTKRQRPLAAGLVGVGLAMGVAAALVVGAITVAVLALNPATAAALAVYAALTISYSCWFQHVPILEIVAISSGFVLRAVIGTLATGVPISSWFMIVTGSAALFIAAGKRYAELQLLGSQAMAHRSILNAYTPGFLQQLVTMAATVTTMAYCLWAFGLGVVSDSPVLHGGVWFRLSILPFITGLLRYSMIIESGSGGAPEEVLLRDRFLHIAGLSWLLLFMVGVYVW